ncbi:retrovirus-related Pol polyprotein from transposon 297 [Trichonephila clavipes]|nr:retrovirus-related Pol polyprotein from transposon 297 [Trichonephila clavipes]
MRKTVKINGYDFDVLIDTGSTVTLVRYSVYANLGMPTLNPMKINLTAFGKGEIQPIGSFTSTIDIENRTFKTDVYVIDNSLMTLDLLIGTDILHQAEFKVSSKGIELLPKTEENCINLINVSESDNQFQIQHVPSKLHSQIIHLLHHYKPIKTETTDIQLKIVLTDDLPVVHKPRRFSYAEKSEITNQIQKWLDNKVIRLSSSDYTSPIVLVKKKNGPTGLCVDYRKLNRKIIKDQFPLPLIEDVIDKLHSAKIFTTLDLKNGFFHVPIDESSKKYTAFITDQGLFEFNFAPFGLCLSPPVFQRYVSYVLRDLSRDGTILVYMDGIIIPSENIEEDIAKLERVLVTAAKFGLEINFKKCQFLYSKIEFLGYLIENGTIKPSPDKLKAVYNFPQPKSIKNVQQCLGLTGYFRKFIRSYSIIAKPLSDLLRHDNYFIFKEHQRIAFQKLKDALLSDPVLCIFKAYAKLQLHTDASKYGYGAILLQESEDGQYHPIYYMSKKTVPHEEKYSSYELEMLAVIEALKKFRHFLQGTQFKIFTDCAAFQQTINNKYITPKFARWAIFLSQFDYQIVHRPGSQMNTWMQEVDT